jgi:hypothetical protein
MKRRKWYKQKEYDFIPNKASVIYGAFLDLGRPVNRNPLRVARSIACMWGEDI